MKAWDHIEKLMVTRGIGKKNLAGICGVQPSAVTKWARGGKIGSDYLSKIAIHFGVTIEELIGHQPIHVSTNNSDTSEVNKKVTGILIEHASTDILRELLDICEHMNDAKMMAVIGRELGKRVKE